MGQAWIAIVAGALLAPLVTWFPMLAASAPWLGLPVYPPAQGIDLYHMQALFLTLLGVLALIVGAQDRYLGLAVALAGLMIFWRGARLDPTHSIVFGLGALALLAVRHIPPAWHRRIMLALGGMACFQALYSVGQRFGFDALWGPWFGGTIINNQALGTFGSVNATAGYIAVVAPLLSIWLLPAAVLVVIASHSAGAALALVVGLAFRFQRVRWVAVLAAVASAPAILWWQFKATHVARFGIWSFGLRDAAVYDPILGYGLGGWGRRIPALQVQQGFFPTNEVWAEAHNEPIQWAAEVGLVGLVLLGCWLWQHRAMFQHPIWGASLAALAAQTLTWHPFHIVSSALLGILLVGLATPAVRQEAT